eukprot:12939013-Prorocentrum_lima.AAC.1
MQDTLVVGERLARTVATVVTQVRNGSVLHGGFFPTNWVLGTRGLRIPGSVLQDGDSEQLDVQEA